MRPISPVIPGENHNEIIVAEHQDEYQNLPSIVLDNGDTILSRWELSEEEKQMVAESGNIYVFMKTFGKPVTPILLMTEKPELKYS